MDIPHRPSRLRSQFSNDMNSTSSMNIVYELFQTDLIKKYGRSPSLTQCAHPKDIHLYLKVNMR